MEVVYCPLFIVYLESGRQLHTMKQASAEFSAAQRTALILWEADPTGCGRQGGHVTDRAYIALPKSCPLLLKHTRWCRGAAAVYSHSPLC